MDIERFEEFINKYIGVTKKTANGQFLFYKGELTEIDHSDNCIVLVNEIHGKTIIETSDIVEVREKARKQKIDNDLLNLKETENGTSISG